MKSSVAVFKTLIFLAGLAPLLWLIYRFLNDDLTANPVEFLVHQSGFWGLVYLMVVLSVTPVRRFTRWNGVIKVRRMLGLFAFFYVFLHFSIYLFLDRELYWDEIIPDIVKRPYITLGFTAFLILVALALTSTRGWIRRLGRRWQKLHRLVYGAALLAVVHFWWLVKADIREPALFAVIWIGLMAARFKNAAGQQSKMKK